MTGIARSDDLRRENQRRILAALRAESPQSRTGLTAATKLSASTVTAITSALFEGGYLVEAAKPKDLAHETIIAPNGRRGRPQVALALNPAAATIGALTLTLNRISAAVVDYSGTLVVEEVEAINTQTLPRDDFGRKLGDLLQKAITKAGSACGPLLNIALTVQGVSDANGTLMHWSPITPHRDLEVGEYLSGAFNVPVTIANDANMIAAALRWNEPERYGDSFAAILLSHGIGMGLVLKGKPFTGIWSSAAEFGHMCHIPNGALCRCGRRGCIEAYAGDYGIWRRASGGAPDTMPSAAIDHQVMAEIARKAKEGDASAITAHREAAEALGHGLRSLFALLDPFPVAFVGSGALVFNLMEPTIRTSLGRKGIGLSYADAEFHCYQDDWELTRKGTIVTALTALDHMIQTSRETVGETYENTA